MKDDKFFNQFIFLAFILVVLLTTLIVKPTFPVNKNVNGDQNNMVRINKVDLIKLEKDYEKYFKRIFNEYEQISADNQLNIDLVKKTKEEILNLKVPAKYKDLHIDFILALVKMENYFSGGDNKEKAASLNAIKQIRENYLWLN